MWQWKITCLHQTPEASPASQGTLGKALGHPKRVLTPSFQEGSPDLSSTAIYLLRVLWECDEQRRLQISLSQLIPLMY